MVACRGWLLRKPRLFPNIEIISFLGNRGKPQKEKSRMSALPMRGFFAHRTHARKNRAIGKSNRAGQAPSPFHLINCTLPRPSSLVLPTRADAPSPNPCDALACPPEQLCGMLSHASVQLQKEELCRTAKHCRRLSPSTREASIAPSNPQQLAPSHIQLETAAAVQRSKPHLLFEGRFRTRQR